MTLPNFFIIGAAKAGTSALYNFLRQHPQIFMSSNKEPNFFALQQDSPVFKGPGDEIVHQRSIIDRREYEMLFASATQGELIIGEASTHYLYNPNVAKRIYDQVPHAKLLALLRNPIDRAFSSYKHLVRDGREKESFSVGLALEKERIQLNWDPLWHYRQVGFYFEQLQIYYDTFPKKQIAVFLYEEFKTNPKMVLQKIYDFLGVEDDFFPDMSVKYNVSGKPKYKRLHTYLIRPGAWKSAFRFIPPAQRRKFVNKIMNWNMKETGRSLSSEDWQNMAKGYEQDVMRLSDLISQDCSYWLQNPYANKSVNPEAVQ